MEVGCTTPWSRVRAERARVQVSLDVFGGPAVTRQLDVVDRGRSVHRDVREDRALHETDEAGRTAVTVHQIVRDLTGEVVSDGTVRHVYTFEDGLIRSMEIQPG